MAARKVLSAAAASLLLSGCVTLSGTYAVTAVRADGTPAKVNIMAEGRGIYTARNAICASEPGATVTIKDARTGQELRSESPYKCKGR